MVMVRLVESDTDDGADVIFDLLVVVLMSSDTSHLAGTKKKNKRKRFFANYHFPSQKHLQYPTMQPTTRNKLYSTFIFESNVCI